jgi:hypothetical protein
MSISLEREYVKKVENIATKFSSFLAKRDTQNIPDSKKNKSTEERDYNANREVELESSEEDFDIHQESESPKTTVSHHFSGYSWQRVHELFQFNCQQLKMMYSGAELENSRLIRTEYAIKLFSQLSETVDERVVRLAKNSLTAYLDLAALEASKKISENSIFDCLGNNMSRGEFFNHAFSIAKKYTSDSEHLLQLKNLAKHLYSNAEIMGRDYRLDAIESQAKDTLVRWIPEQLRAGNQNTKYAKWSRLFRTSGKRAKTSLKACIKISEENVKIYGIVFVV